MDGRKERKEGKEKGNVKCRRFIIFFLQNSLSVFTFKVFFFVDNKEMQAKFVVKRSGVKENFHIEKIKNRLRKLCYGLKCEVTKLSELVFEKIYSGQLTSKLDKIAEGLSVEMGEEEGDPDFFTLASRIFVSDLHKKTVKKFSESPSFASLSITNKDEIRTLVDSMIVYDRDYKFSYNDLKILENTYLLQRDGIIIERPQQLLLRVALTLSSTEFSSKYAELSTSVSFEDLVKTLNEVLRQL